MKPGFQPIHPNEGSSAGDPLLVARDLQVLREGLPVLHIDNFSVNAGEVMAVIGPNGAGKSTLLLVLSRLLPIASGEILFHGRSIAQYKDLEYRRHLALVLQEPLLFDISVYDNVAAGLRFRHESRNTVETRVKEWLDRLGIAQLRDRPSRKLSGGEAQRASLARAFALEPEIMLLDEPFSSLDAPTRARLLEDFQALLSTTNITAILVTHNLDEALLLGDRVAVLVDGRIRQIGPPHRVFNEPADQDVAAFVGVEMVIPGRVMSSKNGHVIVDADRHQLEAVGELNPGREVLFCLRPEDITLYVQKGQVPSSARNRIPGRIIRMAPQGPLFHITLDAGIRLVALITRASVEEMNLKEGCLVTAVFKASAVHLIPR